MGHPVALSFCLSTSGFEWGTIIFVIVQSSSEGKTPQKIAGAPLRPSWHVSCCTFIISHIYFFWGSFAW